MNIYICLRCGRIHKVFGDLPPHLCSHFCASVKFKKYEGILPDSEVVYEDGIPYHIGTREAVLRNGRVSKRLRAAEKAPA